MPARPEAVLSTTEDECTRHARSADAFALTRRVGFWRLAATRHVGRMPSSGPRREYGTWSVMDMMAIGDAEAVIGVGSAATE